MVNLLSPVSRQFPHFPFSAVIGRSKLPGFAARAKTRIFPKAAPPPRHFLSHPPSGSPAPDAGTHRPHPIDHQPVPPPRRRASSSPVPNTRHVCHRPAPNCRRRFSTHRLPFRIAPPAPPARRSNLPTVSNSRPACSSPIAHPLHALIA